MYTYVRATNSKISAITYIGFVVIIGNFFILQLFLAILINNFTEASEKANEERKKVKEKEI